MMQTTERHIYFLFNGTTFSYFCENLSIGSKVIKGGRRKDNLLTETNLAL
jgi:hypothetical protein